MSIEINWSTIIIVLVTAGFLVANYYAYKFNKAKEAADEEAKEVAIQHAAQLLKASETKEEEIVETEKLIRARIEEIENVYKSALADQNVTLELYERYIKNFDAAITLTDKKLKDLDIKGSFSSDDEIGFFFRNVQGLQSVLDKFKIEKETLDQEQLEAIKA